jgi:hypothetical protein
MSDIEAAKTHYRESHLGALFAEFLGQNKLKTRKAKMAKSQFVHFTKRPVHMMTGNDDMVLPRDNEDVDSLIVQSLKQFARERSVRVFLVSSDKQILDKCDLAEDVYPLILRVPPSMPRTMKGTDSTFVDLLVSLSLSYGVLELERIGYLFGEYRGKQSEVYMDEVKLRVHNLQRAKVLQERIDTCKKLKALSIAK